MSSSQSHLDLDVIVVGGGLAGLYSLYKLRELGLSAHAFEAGDGVGGTWYWNRYPGCRCDVESMEYSYSFSPELEQEWRWPERYGGQPQILEYVEHVADRFDLRKHITLNARVTSAHYASGENLWTIATDQGSSASARYIIMATGNLSTPSIPEFPGLDEFAGETYHTGLWPHAGVDFTGKRVAVIGTGSSGVQSIPIIAAEAASLSVFQRTANFILPACNAALDEGVEREHKATYRARRDAAYDTPFGIAGYPPPSCSALGGLSRRARADLRCRSGPRAALSVSCTHTPTCLPMTLLMQRLRILYVRAFARRSKMRAPQTCFVQLITRSVLSG